MAARGTGANLVAPRLRSAFGSKNARPKKAPNVASLDSPPVLHGLARPAARRLAHMPLELTAQELATAATAALTAAKVGIVLQQLRV